MAKPKRWASIPGMSHSMILLHGGNGSPVGLAPLAAALGAHAHVWSPAMLGHGGRDVPTVLSVQAIAEDLLRQMDERQCERSFIGGYSFGAYVALYLARHHSDRFLGVWTLAVKVVFDAQAVSHLVHLTSPERLDKPGHPFADEIKQRHLPQDWRAVMLLNQGMFQSLGVAAPLVATDWSAMSVPALVISGDADPLVPLQETHRLGAWLRCPVVLFPGSAHPLGVVPIQAVAREIGRWMDQSVARSDEPAGHQALD